MNASTSVPESSTATLLRVLHQALTINKHIDLLLWLQGELQTILPHEILLACWGDFENASFHIDVISPRPEIRTTTVMEADFAPLVQDLHRQWIRCGQAPFQTSRPEGFTLPIAEIDAPVASAFRAMRASLAHGMRDQRGRHDCFYIALSSSPDISPETHRNFEVLLPYMDTALRQVAHLPAQYPAAPEAAVIELADVDDAMRTFGLSDREGEIMHWVRAGKTNHEIGLILDISAFTVKNHLKRVFKKLDVLNRAQAVAKMAGG